MPFIRVDLTDAYSKEEAQMVLATIHEQVVQAFCVPQQDRYQVLTRHQTTELILEDTGLGFERSEKRMSIQVFSRKRETQMKVAFYQGVTKALVQKFTILPEDILISIFENEDADWSFGYGRAQFLTGELN